MRVFRLTTDCHKPLSGARDSGSVLVAGQVAKSLLAETLADLWCRIVNDEKADAEKSECTDDSCRRR